ncbi:MAG: uncharacterized protein A8A55_1249 [Amphiamblys sp. WSBS2006]|nr:MAG: uncharacterized protein A8A55_1249 [Amphiamblys sp. WSBS2006]
MKSSGSGLDGLNIDSILQEIDFEDKKTSREADNCGSEDGKEAFDSLMDEIRTRDPKRSPQQEHGGRVEELERRVSLLEEDRKHFTQDVAQLRRDIENSQKGTVERMEQFASFRELERENLALREKYEDLKKKFVYVSRRLLKHLSHQDHPTAGKASSAPYKGGK